MVQTRAAKRQQNNQGGEAQEHPKQAELNREGSDEQVLECDCQGCRNKANAQPHSHKKSQKQQHAKAHFKSAPVPATHCHCPDCEAVRGHEPAGPSPRGRASPAPNRGRKKQAAAQQQQAKAEPKSKAPPANQNNNNANNATNNDRGMQKQTPRGKGAPRAAPSNDDNPKAAEDDDPPGPGRGDSALANANDAGVNEEEENGSEQGFTPPPEQVSVNGSPVYQVRRRLGKGGFGQVYLGVRVDVEGTSDEIASSKTSKGDANPTKSKNTMSGMPRAVDNVGRPVDPPDQLAIKFEHADSKNCANGPPGEWEIYLCLSGVYGVPKVHFKGMFKNFYVMMMDILGPSLWDRWNACNKKMPVEEVACITVEGLSILHSFHTRGYVHGDIKPENFLLGHESTSLQRNLFLVDLGLASQWRLEDNTGEKHILYDQRPDQFRGTVRYASVHAHLGRTLSRRDDLESLAYTILFLLKGQLPWQGFQGEHKGFLVCKKKMSLSPDALCSELPDPFRQFLQAVMNLRFDEEPAYQEMAQLFEPLISHDPNNRPLNTNGMERVGKKRKNDSIDVHEKDEHGNTRKKVRSGNTCLQWITVYDENLHPVKQRYLFGVSNAKFDQHVQKGQSDEPNLFISAVDGGQSDTWALILDNSNRFRQQTWKLSFNQFLPKEWIVTRWEEGYYITAVGGGANYNSVVAMSKGTRFTQQSYKVSDSFPFKWIAKKWREGYFVTSMATSGSRWAVVMSRNSGFVDQRVELDFMYPSEGIHKRWDEGWRITCCAATQDQAAFILSYGKGMRTQETLRTSEFPSEHVQSKWERGLFISDLCFGRTCS
jgi:serine/threonine protein kinase